jgi:hypothetical protein
MTKEISKRLSPGIKFTGLDWLTLIVPGLLPFALGLAIGYGLSDWTAAWGFGFFCFMIWAGVFISIGIFGVEPMTAVALKRLNKSWTVVFNGIGWKNRFLDSVLGETVTLKLQSTKLFEDDPERAEIDFTDGSSPVSIIAYFTVGHPDDVHDEKWSALTKDVLKYLLAALGPRKRLDSVVDRYLRPKLQELSIDEANVKKGDFAEHTADKAAPSLAEIGLYLPANDAIIVEDIALPPEIKEQRLKVLEAEKEAIAEEIRLGGPAKGLIRTRDLLRDAGFVLPDSDILDWARTQIGLEALGKTGSNITFIADSIPGVNKMITVGGRS